jgi:zinc transport system substrate-binding protein
MSRRRIFWGWLLSLPLLALPLGFLGCSSAVDPWENVEGGSLKVLVSFPPLYSFTKSVAGPDAKVLCLLTDVGPHDHKPTAADAIAVRHADLMLINGLELDDTVTKVVKNAQPNLQVVKVAEAIPPASRFKVQDDPHHKHTGDCCAHGEYDPHVWLGIDEAIIMVRQIRDRLQVKDPAHHSGYQERADAYVKELEALRSYGQKAFKDKSNRKLITNHNSFRYFAKTFGLEVVGCIQAQPGVEADRAKMVEMINLCRTDPKQPVQVIAVEPQYKRSAAETLQQQLRNELPKLTIIELDPIETAPRAGLDAGHYVRQMTANIDILAKNLP